MSSEIEQPLIETTLEEEITSNGRISKTLFRKVVNPEMNRLNKEIKSLKKQLEVLEEFIDFVGGYYHFEPPCPVKRSVIETKKKLEELRSEG